MNKHSQEALDVMDVRMETVTLAPQQQAPAQIGHQWYVEKQHLKRRVEENETMTKPNILGNTHLCIER